MVLVSEDPLKVLILDHHPRWDVRYLHTMFQRDRRVTVDQRYLGIHRQSQQHLPAKHHLSRFSLPRKMSWTGMT